jgi:hypothetical protein
VVVDVGVGAETLSVSEQQTVRMLREIADDLIGREHR